MLARSAQGLYWMGRYLERAEFLCRLLRLQVEALVDRPVREIHSGWLRIYDTIGREPPGGSRDLVDSEEFTLADSYTLADDLTFERTTPNSVWSCFVMGRENARQMRPGITSELWTSLNLAYLKIQKLTIQDIWRTSPESFYAETEAAMNTFSGVAAATTYRDDGWRFTQLGRFIERAQTSASLFLAQWAADAEAGESSDADWTSLPANPPCFRGVQPHVQRRGAAGPGAGPAGHRLPVTGLAVQVAGQDRVRLGLNRSRAGRGNPAAPLDGWRAARQH